MLRIYNYLFNKYIEGCKIRLESFEDEEIGDLRKDLRKEAKQIIADASDFFDSIDALNYSDFDDFNSKIKTFNDELNKIFETFYTENHEEGR